MLSSGQFPGVWILYADVSEQSIGSIFVPMKMEEAECSERWAYKMQTPGNYPEESIQLL
jgi:hypothetical protein